MTAAPWQVGLISVAFGIAAAAAPAPAHDTAAQPTSTQGPPIQPQGRSSQIAAPADALILGRVVDGITGSPISGAVVTLGGTVDRIAAANAAGRGAPPPPPNRVVTDGEGRFLFHGLSAGNYAISATKPGYLAGAYGRRSVTGGSRPLVLAESERRSDAVVRLWRFATISGSIVDESGEPAISAPIRLLRESYNRGVKRLQNASNTTTDDRGEFRFHSLAPGTYYVVSTSTTTSTPQSTLMMMQAAESGNAASRQALQRTMQESGAMFGGASAQSFKNYMISTMNAYAGAMTPPDAVDGQLLTYQTVYYPGEVSPAQATPITVAPGEQRDGINLQLRLVPSLTISGTLMRPDGPAGNLGMRLIPAAAAFDDFGNNFTGMEVAATVSEADGRFMFFGVTPGQYMIRVLRVPRAAPPAPPPPPPPPPDMAGGRGAALPIMPAPPVPVTPSLPTEPTLSGELPVSVGNESVHGLNVMLVYGARLTGRIEFEGAAPRPAPDQLRRLGFAMQPLGSTFATNNNAVQISPDGRFETTTYPPGRYLVTATQPQGWMMKSFMVNGRDATDVPFELGPSDIDNVVVTYTDRTTEISGTVASMPQDPDDTQVFVVMMPGNFQQWIENGMVGRRARILNAAGQTGAFVMRGLPEGDYVAVAIRSEAAPAADPETYQKLARLGTRVTLPPGGKINVTLSISPWQQ